jgi:hypothetical protein
MKLVAASVLFYLCAPALGDPIPAGPASPPDSVRIHFALRDPAPQTFDVAVVPSSPCATSSKKSADHEVEMIACLRSDARLDISWSTRSTAGGYHSSSSIPVVHGMTTKLGSGDGPMLEVSIQ